MAKSEKPNIERREPKTVEAYSSRSAPKENRELNTEIGNEVVRYFDDLATLYIDVQVTKAKPYDELNNFVSALQRSDLVGIDFGNEEVTYGRQKKVFIIPSDKDFYRRYEADRTLILEIREKCIKRAEQILAREEDQQVLKEEKQRIIMEAEEKRQHEIIRLQQLIQAKEQEVTQYQSEVQAAKDEVRLLLTNKGVNELPPQLLSPQVSLKTLVTSDFIYVAQLESKAFNRITKSFNYHVALEERLLTLEQELRELKNQLSTLVSSPQ